MISTTIAASDGAAFHLLIIPANETAASSLAAELMRAEIDQQAGGDGRVELAHLAPAVFINQPDIEELTQDIFRDVSADQLLGDITHTLYVLGNDQSPLPAADWDLVFLWLGQLGKLELDAAQTRRHQDIVTVVKQMGFEVIA